MYRPLAAFAVLIACGFRLPRLSVFLSLGNPRTGSGCRKSARRETGRRRGKRRSASLQPTTTDAKVKLPSWWKAGDPVPHVKSNCVRCHLTAGRELTAPVQDFARSVHDLQGMTCSDCHGGNREKDSEAHEEEFGFIGTKLSAHMAGCAECHAEQAEQVKSGPHYWDFSKKINLAYPVCIDCHGHHDVRKAARGIRAEDGLHRVPCALREGDARRRLGRRRERPAVVGAAKGAREKRPRGAPRPRAVSPGPRTRPGDHGAS